MDRIGRGWNAVRANVSDKQITAMKIPQLVNQTNLAEVLGVAESTIINWVKEGRIPAPMRFSRKSARWDLEEVLATLNREKVSTEKRPAKGRRPRPGAKNATQRRTQNVDPEEDKPKLCPDRVQLLPHWIYADPAYARYNAGQRHALAEIANTADDPTEDGHLLGAFAGEDFVERVGCDRKTFARWLRRFKGNGHAVTLSKGGRLISGAIVANVLGIPGRRGALDAVAVIKPGSQPKTYDPEALRARLKRAEISTGAPCPTGRKISTGTPCPTGRISKGMPSSYRPTGAPCPTTILTNTEDGAGIDDQSAGQHDDGTGQTTITSAPPPSFDGGQRDEQFEPMACSGAEHRAGPPDGKVRPMPPVRSCDRPNARATVDLEAA